MRVVRRIGNILISFLLTVLIILNFLMIIVENTVLKEDYMLSQLEEAGFYERINTDLKNGFEVYRYQSGFSEQVFENLYSYSVLKADVNSVVSRIYNGTEVHLSTDEIYNNLSMNISVYLTENNIVLTPEKEQDVNAFKDIIVGVYTDKINSISKYIDDISNVLNKIKKVDMFVVIGLIVSLVFLIMVDILFNIRYLSSFINTIGISLLSTGVLLKIIEFVINKNVQINNILIMNQTISDFLKYVFFNIIDIFDICGIIFIVIGLMGIICRKSCKNSLDNS